MAFTVAQVKTSSCFRPLFTATNLRTQLTAVTWPASLSLPHSNSSQPGEMEVQCVFTGIKPPESSDPATYCERLEKVSPAEQM